MRHTTPHPCCSILCVTARAGCVHINPGTDSDNFYTEDTQRRPFVHGFSRPARHGNHRRRPCKLPPQSQIDKHYIFNIPLYIYDARYRDVFNQSNAAPQMSGTGAHL